VAVPPTLAEEKEKRVEFKTQPTPQVDFSRESLWVMFAYHLVGYPNKVENDCGPLFAHLARFNFAAIAELHANCN